MTRYASAGTTAAAGNVFHFTATTNPTEFPNADFAFPASIAQALEYSGSSLTARSSSARTWAWVSAFGLRQYSEASILHS